MCPSDSRLHSPFHTLLFSLNSRSQDLFQSLSVQRILLFGGAIMSLTSTLLTDIQVISKLSLLQNTAFPCNAVTLSMHMCVCVCVCVWRRNSLKSWWMKRCIFSFHGIAKLCAWSLDLHRLASPRILSCFQILAKVIGKKKYLTEFALPFSYRKVQHLCLCLQVICNASLWTVHILCPFFCWFVSLFLIDLWEYFLYQENELFVHDRSCKYFPPVCHLLFFVYGYFFSIHARFLYSWRYQSVFMTFWSLCST